MNDKDNQILITGVTGGIGSEIAHTFLDNGWVVYGIARTQNIPVSLVNHKNFVFHSVDVSSWKEVGGLFHTLPKGLCAIVNCAGILNLKELGKVTEKDLSETITTNLNGSFHIAKHGSEHFLKNKIAGLIIYVGSRWGTSGSKKDPAYAASKSGLRALVRSLQSESIETGIRHVLLSPGSVFTDMSLSVDPAVEGKILYAKDIADLCLYITNTPKRVIFEEISIKAFPYDFINP